MACRRRTDARTERISELLRQEVEQRCGADATFDEVEAVSMGVMAEVLRLFAAEADNDADG